ncbi:MAG: response regulator [Bacteroidia bacterium]|nr:response regulator [Bacteroidia bacterium]
MAVIKSVILIDSNGIDNFVNERILKIFGVKNIIIFKNPTTALSFLNKTVIKYQVILLDINFPTINGFEFIEQFYKRKSKKKQIKIHILSSSINPSDKILAEKKCIPFIEKPLTIEKLKNWYFV